MFKFLAKVWMAGEINDYRRDRKKRKIQEKQEKKLRRQRNVAELGMVDEIVKDDVAAKKEWEMTQNKLAMSSLVFVISLALSVFVIPFFLVAVLDIFYMILLAIKFNNLKKKHLRK